jgi:hypothetical protein
MDDCFVTITQLLLWTTSRLKSVSVEKRRRKEEHFDRKIEGGIFGIFRNHHILLWTLSSRFSYPDKISIWKCYSKHSQCNQHAMKNFAPFYVYFGHLLDHITLIMLINFVGSTEYVKVDDKGKDDIGDHKSSFLNMSLESSQMSTQQLLFQTVNVMTETL